MTHFSDADGPRGIEHQLQAFLGATQDLPGERSVCNSAATLLHGMEARVRNDWVRPASCCTAARPITRCTRRRLGPAARHDAVDPGHRRAAAAGRRQWATARPLWPTLPCAPASWPAAMPTATRATAARARRCW
jgi:hypothetical protein